METFCKGSKSSFLCFFPRRTANALSELYAFIGKADSGICFNNALILITKIDYINILTLSMVEYWAQIPPQTSPKTSKLFKLCHINHIYNKFPTVRIIKFLSYHLLYVTNYTEKKSQRHPAVLVCALVWFPSFY
jgi:hypothetical protein